MKQPLLALVLVGSLVGCVVNRTAAGPTPPKSGAPAGGGSTGCFAGQWAGAGDDDHQNHMGFKVTFVEQDTTLRGTLEFPELVEGKTITAGTEQVTGSVDCAAGTAELQGAAVTGTAIAAHYKLKLLPENQGDADLGFEATWECGDRCTPGTMKGYRRR